MGEERCALPEDPTLAAVASALNDAGYWAIIVDRQWRNLYMTDAQRLSEGGMVELASFPLGVPSMRRSRSTRSSRGAAG
jgi:hypothetical protein